MLLEEGTTTIHVVMNVIDGLMNNFLTKVFLLCWQTQNKALLIIFQNTFTYRYISCPLKFNVLFCDYVSIYISTCLIIVSIWLSLKVFFNTRNPKFILIWFWYTWSTGVGLLNWIVLNFAWNEITMFCRIYFCKKFYFLKLNTYIIY